MKEEDHLASLYRSSPENFVDARKHLSRLLRSQGRRDEAAAIAAARKPTVVAWVVNETAAADRGAVEALFEATDVLAAAQARAVVSGGAGDLRAATERRRELLDRLTDKALQLLDAGIGGSKNEAIRATLDAGSLDPDLRPTLLRGILTKELPPPSAFGLAALAAVPEQSGSDAGPQDEKESDEVTRSRRRELADQREKAEQKVADCSERVRSTVDQLDAMNAELDELQRALDSRKQERDRLAVHLQELEGEERRTRRDLEDLPDG